MRLLSVAFLGAFMFIGMLAEGASAELPRALPASQAQVQLSYAPLVKKTAPAVVNIYTQKIVRQRVFSPFMNDPFFQHFFGGGLPQGMSRQRLENSLGSGVIVRGDGLIVTSNHVIDGADEITVVLHDRREFEAKLVTADERSDLAVLRIDPKGEQLPFVELGDSDDSQVGDMVLAIGNPFGVGQTVTSGIVSALARTNVDINDINYYIQTDAAINPGNSGGALVGMDGRLLGINAAIFSKSGGNMGVGFAVPVNMVRTVIDAQGSGAGARKRVVRPWTGITGQAVTADIASSLGMDRPLGFLVKGIHPASLALKMGLKVGDVVTSVNGKPVDDFAAFNYRVATIPVGSEIEMGIWRTGRIQNVRMLLVAPPEVPARDETLIEGQNPLSGARIANLSPAVSEDYGLHELDSGVVVVAIKEDTPAESLGLQRGDVIVAINGVEMQRVEAVRKAVEKRVRGWRLAIQRGGSVLTLMIGG